MERETLSLGPQGQGQTSGEAPRAPVHPKGSRGPSHRWTPHREIPGEEGGHQLTPASTHQPPDPKHVVP